VTCRIRQVSHPFFIAYRTRNGSIWCDISILRIMEESSAKGVSVFNTMRQTGNWRTEPKPESEWGKVETGSRG